ncbi:hypothetical protein BC829DRAFT_404917 [Chytridium lagenaria]|nr:hypothetical protein BC829DRAFT_404917 [Chytridium lagenaria]
MDVLVGKWIASMDQADGHTMAELINPAPTSEGSRLIMSSRKPVNGTWTQYERDLPGLQIKVLKNFVEYVHSQSQKRFSLLSQLLTDFVLLYSYEWQIPVLHVLCCELVNLATTLDDIAAQAGQKSDKCYRTLNQFLSLSSKVAGDRGTGANACLRISVKIQEINMCAKIVDQVDNLFNSGLSIDDFPRPHVVTYYYYHGILKMMFHSFRTANTSLTFAWKNCPSNDFKRKRIILMNLVITRLVLGVIPKMELLRLYRLDAALGEIVAAVRRGSFRDLRAAVERRAKWLQRHRFLTIARHRFNIAVFRNLFRKIQTVFPKVMLFETVERACRFSGLYDFTIEDAECIAQSLMDHGYMKGYISHNKKSIMLSSKDPFPKIQISM